MAASELHDQIGDYASIPHSFIDDTRISHIEFRVFIFLRRYRNSKTGDAFPSLDKLEEGCCASRRSLVKAMRGLEEKGWLARKKRFGKSTIYTLKMPSPISSQKSSSVQKATSGKVAPVSSVQRATTVSIISEKDKSKKIKHSSPNGVVHSQLMEYLTTRIGAYRDGAAQGMAVKWLLEHYSVEQAKACLDSQLSEDWRKGRVSWLSVATDIGNWLRKNPKMAQDPQIEQAWQKMLLELNANLGCPNCETVNGRGNYPYSRGYLYHPYGNTDYPCVCNPKVAGHAKHQVYLEAMSLKGGVVNGAVSR